MSEATRPTVAVTPIRDSDARGAAQFLSAHLNGRLNAESWLGLLRPPWRESGAESGFQLHVDGELVGVYAAVYSTREVAGRMMRVCNLAALCVLEQHRSSSLRLVRAAIGQKGMVFTDLSPSGNVPALNGRLGFVHLDTTSRLTVNLPFRRRRGTVVSDDPHTLSEMLTGRDAIVYRDHRDAPAANHVLIVDRDRYAYVVYRRETRKRLHIFALPLYVGGDTGLLEESWSLVARHLFRRGLVATIAERRILGFVPRGPGRTIAKPRPRMFKAAGVEPGDVDYLYSELTLIEW